MSIEISDIYKSDTSNSRQSVVPLVVIYKNIRADAFETIDTILDSEKLFLSTQNIHFDGNYYEPLLLNVPDLKESVDLKTKQYRIQNSTISISNVEFHGRKFSENIKDVINCAVRVYWKSQSCKTLEDCSMITQGSITRFTQTKTSIKLSLEDISQLSLQKLIPELIPDDSRYAKQDRLTPFPMVYGHVNRSPLKKKIDANIGLQTGEELVSQLVADTEPISKLITETTLSFYPAVVANQMPEQTAIYLKDGENYVNLINNLPAEYEDVFEIDSFEGQMFEISGGDILTTPLFAQIQQQVMEIYGFESPAMGRVLRRISNIRGHRKARSRQISSNWYGENSNSGTGLKIGGQLYAVSNLTEDPWTTIQTWLDHDGSVPPQIPFGSDHSSTGHPYQIKYMPNRWYNNMFSNDNQFSKSSIMFPFNTDDLSLFVPYQDQSQNTWNGGADELDDEIFGHLVDWNTDVDQYHPDLGLIKPNDYIGAILEDDNRGLGWYGRQESETSDEGAELYWEFVLDPLETNAKCITWCYADIRAYIGYGWTLGTEDTHEFFGGNAMWGGDNFTPKHPNAQYKIRTDEEEWSKDIHHFPSFTPNTNQYIKNLDGRLSSGRNVEQFGPTSSGYENYANGTKFIENTIIEGWNTPNQFKSIKLGIPHSIQKEDLTQFVGYYCGAVNYLHFIQDVFIENVNEKTWYANVYGRLSQGVTTWTPFNSFITEGIPEWVDATIDNDVRDYVKSQGYDGTNSGGNDGTGGEAGWLVNGGASFVLSNITDNMDYVPEKIWYLNALGTMSVFSNGIWANDYTVSTGRAFIFYTETPVRIIGNDVWKRNFIRMHLKPNEENVWEEGFDNTAADNMINDFYTANGWNDNLYIPEVNIDGMVDTPHGIVQHLLDSEIGYNPDYYDEKMLHLTQSIHQGWRMAFTMTKQTKLKDLIEDFATNTKMFPKFRADGTFTFNPMKSFYNMSDVRYKIYAPDVQSFSFQLTNIEDVYDQVKLLYQYDYGNNNFNKELDTKIYTTSGEYSSYWRLTTDLYSETNEDWVYDLEKTYNKTVQEGFTQVEAKYIRDLYTANEFKKYKLMENINQKLIIKLELSTKFLNLEAGDVIYISQLSKDTAFGYKYWTYEIKSGQLVYPYFIVKDIKKKTNKVTVEAQQLHRLEYGLPLWYIEAYNADPNFTPPLTEKEIEAAVDNGNIYNGNGEDVTVTYQSQTNPPEIPLNEYFNAIWETDNIIDWNINSTIRLNINQTPYTYENPNGVTWTVEVEDVIDGVGQGYNELSSNNFQLNSYNGGDPANNQGYVIIKTRTQNFTYPINQGRLRITTQEGLVMVKTFYQNWNTEYQSDTYLEGDVTQDGIVNILDIVQLVNYILNPNDYPLSNQQISNGDMNNDGGINILDVVQLVDYVLEN